jgi:drug/metabolite transporter (DMT)-like permease
MNWQIWTLGESATKIVSSVLQKLAGIAIANPATALIYSGIIGVVQVGIGLSLRKKNSVFADARNIMLSILCGIGASIANVLGPVAFMYNADLAGRTFIVTMSVIPGMFLGQIFFNQVLSARQYLGIAVFIFGAWAILGGPDVYTLIMSPPTWVWLTVIVALMNALNESFRNAMTKDYSSMVNNFWLGATVAIVSLGGYLFLALSPLGGALFGGMSGKFILYSLLTGLVVVVMVTMSLKAYQGGAYIALKKVLMNSTHLVGAAIVGSFFFGESLTAYKWLGMFMFALAVFLIDNAAWNAIFTKKPTVKTA